MVIGLRCPEGCRPVYTVVQSVQDGAQEVRAAAGTARIIAAGSAKITLRLQPGARRRLMRHGPTRATLTIWTWDGARTQLHVTIHPNWARRRAAR